LLKKLTLFLAKAVYGLFLPLCLLWFAFNSHFEYKQADQLNASRAKMEESLELLVNLHQDENFFHALFQKNFSLADRHENPDKALTKRILALKKYFPDALQFIVWDEDGKINKDLSEEKSFQYVLKSMYQVCHEILQHYRTVVPPDPASVVLHFKLA
jgi:hypothetical protein